MDRLVESGTAANQAYQYIKKRVISGDFSPGMRLTEEQLAREIGASRTPIREALRLLDRKSTRLNSSHLKLSRMPSSA